MSKCGRKPILCGGVSVEVSNNNVIYKSKDISGSYFVPLHFIVKKEETKILIFPSDEAKKSIKEINMLWGLHRSLLNNAISGAIKPFEKQIKIDGLGFKAQMQGNIIVFSLGFSHKIQYEVPKGVSIEIDKTGQNMTFKSSDKSLLGAVCASIRDFRVAEPYKGKGLRYSDENILRKAGKTK